MFSALVFLLSPLKNRSHRMTASCQSRTERAGGFPHKEKAEDFMEYIRILMGYRWDFVYETGYNGTCVCVCVYVCIFIYIYIIYIYINTYLSVYTQICPLGGCSRGICLKSKFQVFNGGSRKIELTLKWCPNDSEWTIWFWLPGSTNFGTDQAGQLKVDFKVGGTQKTFLFHSKELVVSKEGTCSPDTSINS